MNTRKIHWENGYSQDELANVCNTTTVKSAWKNGSEFSVHGWIYNIENGILKDLDTCVSSSSQ